VPSVLKAAVISRDWKAPGDGLLTYDDANQREWLDFSQTYLSDQFPGVYREEKYQYVAGQIAAGGLFEGFIIAKSNDVLLLAQSAGIETSTLDYSVNALPAAALGQLLGYTATSAATGSNHAAGEVDELRDSEGSRGGAWIGNSRFNRAGVWIGVNDLRPGVWLYRPVPEPAALWLAVMCAIVAKRGVR
jgi:hypothetical protein